MDYKTAISSYTKIPLEEDLRLVGDRCFIHFLTENILINIKIAVIAPTFAKLTFETVCCFPFIREDTRIVGYFGVQVKGDELYLSKIYVLSSDRGLGIGRAAMNFIKQLAQEYHLGKISLTVNRNNSVSIAAYYKMGFGKFLPYF